MTTPAVLESAFVADEVWELRPDYAACLVTARGVGGGPCDEHSEAALVAAEEHARRLLADHDLADVEQVAQWREAFRGFGVRPRQAVSSLESLLRRAADGLPRVDRLTDHYNAISVTRGVPLGGEDLDAYAGPPRLVRATGDEAFDALERGEVRQVQPRPAEVVWRDDLGVTCRRWNWRQGARTRLGPDTRNALYIIDGLGPGAAATVAGAGDDLVAVLREVAPDVQVQTRVIRRG